MITDLNSFKDVKKAKKVVEGLQNSLKALQTSLDILKHYKQYVTIMESLSTLSTSYKITEIQIKRVKEFIKENDK